MIYKNFTIEKYKGISTATIDLSNNRILTLVGLNESGKTTVMEALHLFYKIMKGFTPTGQDLNKYRPKGADFSGTIKISGNLIFEEEDKLKIQNHWNKILHKKTKLIFPNILGYDINFIYKLNAFVKSEKHYILELHTESSKNSLSQSQTTSLLSYIKEEIVPEILFYDDFIFDIPDEIIFYKSSLDPVPEEDSTQKIWKAVLDDVVRSVNPEMTIQEHIADKYSSDPSGVDNLLDRMSVELNDKITNAWIELYSNNKKINFKEITLSLSTVENGIKLSFKIKTATGQVFSLNERSKGFKWFFAFLLFTEFRKTRTKNILFLLDEPASNLASSAQAKLLKAIENLSDKSLVIYSTHSHHLINPKWLDGAYIVVNEYITESNLSGDFDTKDGAKIFTIKYFQYVGKGLGSDKVSYFQPILDALDYQPSTVEPIPNIVILEGKNDWYTFNYFEGIIFSTKKKLNLYPGAGKDKLQEIIRLYMSWGKDFIVLLDGDIAGQKAKEKYLREFDDLLANRIFTLKDIFSKDWETEDLFLESDKKRAIDTIFGKGSYDSIKSDKEKLKTNLNYSINHLQIDKKKLSFTAKTQANFRTLFKFLHKRLP